MKCINVFEFLGIPANHRADNKVVQLVKHFDDVNPKAEEDIYHKKVEFPMLGQVKKDGVFAMLVVTLDKVGIFGRTGKELKSCDRLITHYESLNLDVGVYIAELCSDDCSLEVLSGIVNPNRVNELNHAQSLIRNNIKMYFHDHLFLTEFITGSTKAPYQMRLSDLYENLPDAETILGTELIQNQDQLREYAKYMISLGNEGAVFKQNVGWLAGAKDWHSMKIVRGVSYDLECIGYEEGTGKYAGKVANLIFRWKSGRTIKAMLGKGWTHVNARNMYEQIKHIDAGGSFPTHYIGSIFEVYALQESSKGVLRLPKVGELRFDKCSPDF